MSPAREPAAGPPLHQHVFRLSYGDTDPAGILYYGAWLPRMEALQSEWLLFQGLRQDTLAKRFGWWTVSRASECEYLEAARLFDEIRIELRMGRIGTTSLQFEFEMWRLADGVRVGRGSNTIVTVSPELVPIPIPDDLRARLDEWAA